MSQVSDVSLANQGFSAFRTELNNILGALNTSHVGSSAPASVAQGTIWVDSGTSGVLKVKINDGSDNVELFQINISRRFKPCPQKFGTMLSASGVSKQFPKISFKLAPKDFKWSCSKDFEFHFIELWSIY